jgi:hypothetical protein
MKSCFSNLDAVAGIPAVFKLSVLLVENEKKKEKELPSGI